MLLYYIRHGDPVYSPDSLTPLGERQAEAVGRRLALHGVDDIYASSSKRAQLTGKPLAEMLKKEIGILDWMSESHFWHEATTVLENGQRTWICAEPNFVKLFNSPELMAMGRDWEKHPDIAATALPAGLRRIERELDAFLEGYGLIHDRERRIYIPNEQYDDKKRIALFAHAGFGTGFFSCLMDIIYPEIATRFDLPHSGVSIIRFRKCGDGLIPQIMSYSDLSHIYAEHLPMRYNNGQYI